MAKLLNIGMCTCCLELFSRGLPSTADMLAVPKAYAHGNFWFDVSSVILESLSHINLIHLTISSLSIKTQI